MGSESRPALGPTRRQPRAATVQSCRPPAPRKIVPVRPRRQPGLMPPPDRLARSHGVLVLSGPGRPSRQQRTSRRAAGLRRGPGAEAAAALEQLGGRGRTRPNTAAGRTEPLGGARCARRRRVSVSHVCKLLVHGLVQPPCQRGLRPGASGFVQVPGQSSLAGVRPRPRLNPTVTQRAATVQVQCECDQCVGRHFTHRE